MKNKNDKNMPIGKVTQIEDFLPPPEKLIMPKRSMKVTILLSESSVNSFKELAKKHHTKYQKIIRKLLDKYVETYLAHS
ncbi:MAG: CopG family transcriptional regulator [Candidatus Omnitrophota bacterium]